MKADNDIHYLRHFHIAKVGLLSAVGPLVGEWLLCAFPSRSRVKNLCSEAANQSRKPNIEFDDSGCVDLLWSERRMG